MRSITLAEFRAELEAQGVQPEDAAFRCPVCRTIQSGRSLIAAGAGKTFADVGDSVGFSCVGRWTNAGPHKAGTAPGKGCDWTLGGLFKLQELEVRAENDLCYPFFEIATPEEAQALAAASTPTTPLEN